MNKVNRLTNKSKENTLPKSEAKSGPNLNGPETMPLKNYNKECQIVVTVWDNDDKVIRREFINYGNYEERAWLGKISFYAYQNDYVVETQSKKNYDANEKE